MESAELAVARVVRRINLEYNEELTIDDLAATAMYSKFHFTRLFQRVTGVTPGRYLSAVRLQMAKELLLSTELTVTEISHEVGYASVGTFSSRFAQSVGAAPSTYRELGGFRPSADHPRAGALAGRTTSARAVVRDGRCSKIHGHVEAAEGDPTGPVFVGAFPGPLHQGRPVSVTVLDAPGPFTLENVPEDDWYVLACCACSEKDAGAAGPGDPLLVDSLGPLTVRSGQPAMAELGLHPSGVLEPPVLLALPAPRAPEPVRTAA